MQFFLSPIGSLLAPLVLFAIYVLPLVAVIWALVTLARLRTGQADILARLSAIERRLRELSKGSGSL